MQSKKCMCMGEEKLNPRLSKFLHCTCVKFKENCFYIKDTFKTCIICVSHCLEMQVIHKTKYYSIKLLFMQLHNEYLLFKAIKKL
jgi:hypothetical protein